MIVIVVGAIMFLILGGIANATETIDQQETCPNTNFDPVTGGWIKVDGLDGYTYTFTDIPDGFTVTDNCHKRATIVVYGTGVTVTSPDKYELSHASFLLVPDETPETTTTTTEVPPSSTTTTTVTDTTTSTTTTQDTTTTTPTTPTTTEPTSTTTATEPPSSTTTTSPPVCNETHPNYDKDSGLCELPVTGVDGLWPWFTAGVIVGLAGVGLLQVGRMFKDE